MFKDKITIANGFQTSINIAYDQFDVDKIMAFIPTESSLDVIEDILLSTAPADTKRSRILIGAYGRGKSHVILVLLSLLEKKNKRLFSNLLHKMKQYNPDLYEYTVKYLESNRKLLPVIVRGGNNNLSAAFLGALKITLEERGYSDLLPETNFQLAIDTIAFWKRNFPNTYANLESLIGCPIEDFIVSLKEYDPKEYERFVEYYPKLTSGGVFNPYIGANVIEVFELISSNIKQKGYDGLFVVYDEFSKFLETNISSSSVSEIQLLQDLAEKCNRSGENQLHLLLISHKEISNYIDGNLSKEKVDGWRGVSGRFKHVHLYNNFSQMYEVISQVIKKEDEFWETYVRKNKNKFEELTNRFTRNGLLNIKDKNEVYNAIYGCYPLHPVSTFILPRLSEKVAQNERTSFTFLSSEDRGTLPAFLNNCNGSFPLITPDYIYDYFEPLLRKEPYTSEFYQLYKVTSNVLRRVDANSLASGIIKTISLIYLIQQFEVLPPTVNTICDTFVDTVEDIREINDTLRELIDRDCIIYLKRSNDYLKLKESSGVDIPGEIANFIERNKTNLSLKEILKQSTSDNYLFPTRYNDEFEVTRYFELSFIDSSNVLNSENWRKLRFEDGADGGVYAVMPRNDSEVDEIRKKLFMLSNQFDQIVFIAPRHYKDITQIAFEYEAVCSLRLNAADDEILADEFDLYIDDLSEVLGSYINTFVRPESGGATYFYKGKEYVFYRRSQLSELLSKICEALYFRTPILKNEAINKNILPTQTIKSRMKILTGLLSPDLAPNLGLSGNGQEVSIMRSVLIQTGILENVDNNPQLNLEPSNKNLCSVLQTISSFFSRATHHGEASFKDLYDDLTSPKNGFGLKRGVIPILIATVLRHSRNYLVVKYKTSELKVTPELLSEINAHPEDYSVVIENWNDQKTIYIDKLEKLFIVPNDKQHGFENVFSVITSSMNRWFINLPKYSKELLFRYKGRGKFEKVSESHKRLANKLRQVGNNPREFIFETLPSICSNNEDFLQTIESINSFKSDRDNAISELVSFLGNDIKEIFSSDGITANLCSIMQDWFETLDEKVSNHLFPGIENSILEVIKTSSHNERDIVYKLGKAVTSLRLEDWNQDVIMSFFESLRSAKKNIEQFGQSISKDEVIMSNCYKISFVDNEGKEKIRMFSQTEYSNKAKLLRNDLINSIEEMGSSISDQEKRQVLIEILENLC